MENENIVKQANDIISSAEKEDRKELAFMLFTACFAFSGLAIAAASPDKKVEVMEDMIKIFKDSLIEHNYKIKAGEKEIEVKIGLLHVKLMLNPIPEMSNEKEIEKYLRKEFDALFWDKCIFA